MCGNIEFIRDKGAYTAHLQNTFTAVHCGNFVLGHKLLTELLEVQPVGHLASSVFAFIKAVDCFLTQDFRDFFERRFLLAAEKQHSITVADNGICVIFVNGF